jgi:Amt family ammonium transporter
MTLPLPVNLLNNLWVLISGILVFIMTIAVGFLEVGELGEDLNKSLLKTMLINGSALFFMAFLGFNLAFAPTVGYGFIGNPAYAGPFLGAFSSNVQGVLVGNWWSMGEAYFNTGITLSTYFFFESAFAAVTLALVGVITLRKMKHEAFFIFSIVYFLIIWTLPAAWIWNPTGWLYILGMKDFAGGLVVHGAAGAAGLAIVYQIWREEKKKGFKESPKVAMNLNIKPGWLTLSILLLLMGWFGFNPGSVLAINHSSEIVVLTTFLAASSALWSTMLFKYLEIRKNPGLFYADNGILMGLIIITPLAAFVDLGSAIIIGFISGPLYIYAEKWFSQVKWFSDPIGLFPGHMLGGLVGVILTAFFTQRAFSEAAGYHGLPNGLFFGGGFAAVQQLGIQALGIVAVMVVVFVISFVTVWLISKTLHGITTDYKKEGIIS